MDAIACDAVNTDTASPSSATAHPRTAHYRPTCQAISCLPTSTSRAFSPVHAHDCTAHIRRTPVRPAKPCACACHVDTPTRPATRQAPLTHHTSSTRSDMPSRARARPYRPHATSTVLFQSSRAKPSATCLPNPARAGKEVAMIFGGVEARSGVGRRLGRSDPRDVLLGVEVIGQPRDLCGADLLTPCTAEETSQFEAVFFQLGLGAAVRRSFGGDLSAHVHTSMVAWSHHDNRSLTGIMMWHHDSTSSFSECRESPLAVSKRLRHEIFRRDNHTCQSCGAKAPDVKLEPDHVIPVTLGGSDDPSNLTTLCADCNGGKSATPPDAATVAKVAEDATRWSQAIRVAADRMLDTSKSRDAARAAFDEKWSSWSDGRPPLPRPVGWEMSVDNFLKVGLPLAILLDCVDIAMSKRHVKADDVFKYMCGVAWKEVAKLQSSAGHALQRETRPKEAPSADSPSDDHLVKRGRYSLAHSVLASLTPWDRQAAFARMVEAAAPYEPTTEELEIAAALDAVQAIVAERSKLYDITMGFLHAVPGGEQRWQEAAAELASSGGTHLPGDVIEKAVWVVLNEEPTANILGGLVTRDPGDEEYSADLDPAMVPGRHNFACQVLADYSIEEIDHFRQVGGDFFREAYGSEPTPEVCDIRGAEEALSHTHWAIWHLDRAVSGLFDLLPAAEVEQAAEDSARQMLQAGTVKPGRLGEALQIAGAVDIITLRRAEAYLAEMTEAERAEWIRYAVVWHGPVNPWDGDAELSDDKKVRHAAHVAKVVKSGRLWRRMCLGAGEHIERCPERARFAMFFEELECCTPDPEPNHVHALHGVCERHLAEALDSGWNSTSGAHLTVRDFKELDNE